MFKGDKKNLFVKQEGAQVATAIINKILSGSYWQKQKELKKKCFRRLKDADKLTGTTTWMFNLCSSEIKYVQAIIVNEALQMTNHNFYILKVVWSQMTERL